MWLKNPRISGQVFASPSPISTSDFIVQRATGPVVTDPNAASANSSETSASITNIDFSATAVMVALTVAKRVSE